MNSEREDLVAPPIPPPKQLTANEQIAVVNYLNQGADIHALADYFGTTATIIDSYVYRSDGEYFLNGTRKH